MPNYGDHSRIMLSRIWNLCIDTVRREKERKKKEGKKKKKKEGKKKEKRKKEKKERRRRSNGFIHWIDYFL